jgi:ABC-type antimicrobial peptide transport system permease subunit
MVMRQGIASAGLGIVLGVAGSAALRNLLRGMPFSVAPRDVVTFGAVGALMLTTAMLASYIPARRATRVDPLTALRAD